MADYAPQVFINCDIGERGIDNATDNALLKTIHMANIACGGHAGDQESAQWFCEQAQEHNLKISIHLSYPDTQHFGRRSLNLPTPVLFKSLHEQRELLPSPDCVKFHGALYNDACIDFPLATMLTHWARNHGITTIVAPAKSAIATVAEKSGLGIIAEAFPERRYCFNPDLDQLQLVDRAHPSAVIHNLTDAVAQGQMITKQQQVIAYNEIPGGPSKAYPISAQTLCIHSDSPIALALAQSLYQPLA